MIKIIISGTYDGFYPRYATDGILDDDICKKLLDRRMYFSKAGDSLFKEGYSFQCVKDFGIFYHKIILLFDALGRDGFMMASLFLPVGEKLDGKEIKDTLDSIVRDYKNRTSNGIASIDLDWSFVKRKADELVQKVKTLKWEKCPINNASGTALIRGVDNRVADYFDYPNPLHRVLSDFEQIFLTESLLDPSMISDNGEQGYKVLEKEIVDIDNPEYTIVYNRKLLQDENLSCVKKVIKKKELDSYKGDIPLGTLSRAGYRSAMVNISNKVSNDGSTIIVTLPNLEQKKATVILKLIDQGDGKIVPSYNCNIEWSNQVLGKSKIESKGEYNFYREGCDKEWHLSVKSDTYQDFEEDIYVPDGIVETKDIPLTPKPKWNVFIQRPDGTMRPFSQGILVDDLDYQIKSARSYLKDQGLEVESPIRDEESRIVTITGKQKKISNIIINDPVLSSQNNQPKVAVSRENASQSDKDNNVISDKIDNCGNSQVGILTTSDTVILPEKQRKIYYLYLDTESSGFLLFQNYYKKQQLAEGISKYIQLLESFKNQGNKVFKEKIGTIISSLKDYNSDNAENALSHLLESDKKGQLSNSTDGRKIIDSIRNAIKAIDKHKSIVNVVKAPDDVRYNSEKHRLECERTECPKEQVALGKDLFEYGILDPSWTTEENSLQKNQVKRKLRTKYKVVGVAVPIVVLFAIVFFICYFTGNDKANEMYQGYKKEITVLLNEYNRLSYDDEMKFNTHYIGDSLFLKLGNLNKQINEFIKDNKIYKDSFNVEELGLILRTQTDVKKTDETIYVSCINMLESESNPDLNKWHDLLYNSALSKAHFQELNQLYQDKINKGVGEPKDESKVNPQKILYEQCLSNVGTVNDIDKYFSTYGSDNKLGGRLVQIASNNNFGKNERIKACDLYIHYYPNGRKIVEIKNIKNFLEGRTGKTTIVPKTKESQNQDTTNGVGKQEIKSATGILSYLAWDYVKDNGKLFHEKCDVKNKNIRNEIEKIITNANSQGADLYRKAYNSAKNDRHNTTDIIKLEHYLGMHGASCKSAFGSH